MTLIVAVNHLRLLANLISAVVCSGRCQSHGARAADVCGCHDTRLRRAREKLAATDLTPVPAEVCQRLTRRLLIADGEI